jgi:hypothetical protein
VKIARQNGGKPYFLFVRPSQMPKNEMDAFTINITNVPFLTNPMSDVGISAIQDGNKWIGSSYTLNRQETPLEEPMYFRALLLPFLPDDFDFLIGGMNFAGQINKIDDMIANDSGLPKLSTMIDVFAEKYLPGVDFKTDISPLLENEFSAASKDGKVIFITELKDKLVSDKISKIFEAFKTSAPKITPTKKEFTLADGTTAEELVSDSSNVIPYKEELQGAVINGIVLNKDGTGLFSAVAQDKWFLASDLALLKKSLILTREPEANFRDGQTYAETLRPILKNPEFFGVMSDKLWTFGFSKRMFPDHMETDFLFMVK